MNKATKISNDIIEYKQAYEALGIQDPPPYRITCREHKELVELCKQFIVKPRLSEEVGFTASPINPISMIASYYGVQLEVVMIVDAYL